MRKYNALFLLWGFILIFSCKKPLEKQGDFNLLPLPQQFEITGNSRLHYQDIHHSYSANKIPLPILGKELKNLGNTKEKSEAQIIYGIDKSLDIGPEGYTMGISKNQITLTGKDQAGLFYAFKTLEQLMQDAKEQKVPLPMCTITDFPLLTYRAIHIDVKHHLEKPDYYYKLMDKLASYKINAVIVEMEDKLKYELQPRVASTDALSIDAWKKLSDYANERNIEISPLIQGLGHASFILKHQEYMDLRDDPKSDWAFNPLNPKTYEVQFDLYRDALKATPHGRYLHVGGDEVHTTGRNSGKSSLELQLIWLNKVCKFAEEHNRIPIFWDDMPLKQVGLYNPTYQDKYTQEEVDSIWARNEPQLAQFLEQLPKNCIYMRWNYGDPNYPGNLKAMEWYTKNGLQVMGATAGQTRWVLMPQNESNIANIKAFALNSIRSGLQSLLLTLWDDDSPHFELYMRGIIAFAEYTWSGDKRAKAEVKTAYRHREFSNTLEDSKYAFIDDLEKPVAFWKNALLKGNKRNYLKKMEHPLEEGVIDLPGKNKKGEWSTQYADRLQEATQIIQSCDSIAKKIGAMKSKAVRNRYSLEVYEQVNQLVQFAPKALLALKAYDLATSKEQELEALRKLKKLPEEFKILRRQLEAVYGKTRILTKPDDYILDQDHHVHLANQTISFDWQFMAEILFLEKVGKQFKVL